MQYFVTVLLCSCNETVILYLTWIPMFVTGLSNHEHRDYRTLFTTFAVFTCFVFCKFEVMCGQLATAHADIPL